MPHIHNLPDQHDMTVSALIMRKVDGGWKCLVHYHKKIHILMQIGGHIELNETPWQAMAHELAEETGYTLGDLNILQFSVDKVTGSGSVFHPVPLSINTHSVGGSHYHTDMSFAFIAKSEPNASVAENESNDLRWMSIAELNESLTRGTVLKDTVMMYDFTLKRIDQYAEVPAVSFSIEKPETATVMYKHGAPGQA